jgi:asparaginyl-tRNA synthetase
MTSLSTGAAVRLSGRWTASHGSKQSHELRANEATVLGENDAEHNPIQPKYQTAEFLRTVSHLRPRVSANALLLRLRSQVISSLTSFFNWESFVQCHTPIITSSDCEGAGEVFTVSSNASKASEQKSVPETEAQVEHFFRTPKYLTVSAQLHLEALSQAVDKVWTLSPTFRAEKSDTPRHLSEFYMLEAELCFTQSLEDVMSVVENMLVATATDLNGSALAEELLKTKKDSSKQDNEEAGNLITADVLTQRWAGMMTPGWPRISYVEAIQILQAAASEGKANFVFQPTWKDGLQAEHERYIAAAVGEGRRPVFITDYPKHQKPFYMLPSDGTADTVACFDLIVPELCELVGGSLREYRSAKLQENMRAKGVSGENLEWYNDLRKYGSAPHGGFGMGFDRLLCYLSGTASVRDVVAFPRWHGRCDC